MTCDYRILRIWKRAEAHRGETEMTRTYKGHEITRNHAGKWIVRHANGSLGQHAALADAKDAITMMVDVAAYEA